ncbi:hypothetical protein GCM10009609_58730 [Pseudonocardia aurantiaca]|uniref:Septum formation initiator n=1 Tax=Pseudonocardia aurantiaca TaxID=75290 RepID=A0ABW4FZ44_9PSEU
MTRRTGPALAALAWTATVVVATVVGMSAVGAIGSGILGAGQEPLTPAQVDQALAAARTAPAAPPPAAPAPATTSASAQPPPPAPDAATEVLTSPGGTVVARCVGGLVQVVSATPAQGFRLHDEHEGFRVRFRSDESDVRMELSCQNGRPVGAVRADG